MVAEQTVWQLRLQLTTSCVLTSFSQTAHAACQHPGHLRANKSDYQLQLEKVVYLAHDVHDVEW
jgi:hypothetical protein